jgi:transcriptional regulator with GAF, ATPase, and Fis domain
VPREGRLVETFVTLADTLVDNYDVIDFLQTLAERCVELLDVSEAGIMLADGKGGLRHAACSSERMRLVELFELQLEEGPCFDAYTQGVPVVSGAPEDLEARWPAFAPHAHDAGFATAVALPMRLRNQVIGALNLFSSEVRKLTDEDVRVGQAMADIATIGILQERTIRGGRTFSTQLQAALDSRVAIEQAKGIVAEHNQIDVDEAFGLLRAFTRDHNRLLAETCRQVIAGTLQPEALTSPKGSVKPPSTHA